MLTTLMTAAILATSQPSPADLPNGDAMPGKEMRFKSEAEEAIRKNRHWRRAEAAKKRKR